MAIMRPLLGAFIGGANEISYDKSYVGQLCTSISLLLTDSAW